MIEHIDTSSIYQTQWMAYFKPGLGSPTTVYGNNEEEAMRNALAYYRKNQAAVDLWPRDRVVDHVEHLG